MNLGVHHLRAIVAVADHRSFTVAATHLGVVQSSLSRTVLEAERRLQTPLFRRSTRRVVLTTDGEAVVAVARGVIEQVDAGLEHIEGYLAGTRGSITIATLPSLAATLLPPVIRRYQELHPDVVLHVEDDLSDQVAEHLQSGRADLALTTDPENSKDYVVRPIAEDSFFLAVHPAHRYAEAGVVNWTDLQTEPMIAFGPASSVQQAVARALRDAGVSPATIVRAQNVAAIAGLVASGLGVAPVPGFVLPLMRFAGLTAVQLVPQRSRTITLVHHRDRPLSPAVRAWVDVVDQYLGAQPQKLPGVHWIRPEGRLGS
ncbi:LysR family transcriptional regulator [Citricoccus nitrophenolicus]|uniref:LysR family transcriptional regulator n=1 Tax=Citricoccus nitrophenolicus TaxID=863575 RepID=UPI0039B3971B